MLQAWQKFDKISTYNDVCLQYLLGNEICVILLTQIRTDIAHLIHAVTRWPCLKNSNWIIKDVYTKCIGFLNTVQDLKQFEVLSKNILFVSLSKYINVNF